MWVKANYEVRNNNFQRTVGKAASQLVTWSTRHSRKSQVGRRLKHRVVTVAVYFRELSIITYAEASKQQGALPAAQHVALNSVQLLAVVIRCRLSSS